MKRSAAIALPVAATPVPGAAHTFDPGADIWGQILEAALLPVSDPALILALLPLGLMLGLWRIDGLAQVWPALLAGLVAGSAAAPLAGLGIAFAAIVTGLGTALLGVLALNWPFWMVSAAAAGTGIVAAMTALEGHAFGSVPATVHVGILLGAVVTVCLSFLPVSWTRALTRASWVSTGWRVASSWIAATAILLAALRFA